MLKNKFLALSIISVMLSACGGGDGSSSSGNSTSSGNNSSSNSNEVKAELFPNGEAKLFSYTIDIDYGQDSLDSDKSEWNIQKGILLEKTKNPIFYNHYVTQKDGLYIPETEQTYNAVQGIRDSFIHSMSSTTWVTSPYNQAGFKDLKLTQKVKEIDLQGLRIVDQFAPALISMHEFEVKNGGSPNLGAIPSQLVNMVDTFPRGAKCVQVQGISSNQLFFEFGADGSYEIPNARILQDWADQEFKAGKTAQAVPDIEVWGKIKIGSLLDKNDNPSEPKYYQFALEYQGKVYQAFPQQPEWTSDELVEELKSQFRKTAWFQNVVVPLGKAKEDQFMASVEAKMRSQCNYYNAEAAKSVDSVLSKVKK
ncbi:hypothetical protein MMP61_05765 [Acinetobacter sp. NIPH 1958]|uniref:hypothetical protein n=1 Tax=Acinetobacter sp. NIPH 1958 TaxID=2923430 RepID=UPI001F4B490C|nr:hypothetical protein [Acinetobacter sp. NIPH 1958]MCH7355085.1 hypothetical protein [Acinetobacter sp. NIPH 1958]